MYKKINEQTTMGVSSGTRVKDIHVANMAW